MADKPILCVDFDNTIFLPDGQFGTSDEIIGRMHPQALGFLQDAVKVFRVNIYSSRSGAPTGIAAMKAYMIAYSEEWAELVPLLEWPSTKPPATVSIDDRAITFIGVFPPIDVLLKFKPWNG